MNLTKIFVLIILANATALHAKHPQQKNHAHKQEKRRAHSTFAPARAVIKFDEEVGHSLGAVAGTAMLLGATTIFTAETATWYRQVSLMAMAAGIGGVGIALLVHCWKAINRKRVEDRHVRWAH